MTAECRPPEGTANKLAAQIDRVTAAIVAELQDCMRVTGFPVLGRPAAFRALASKALAAAEAQELAHD